MIAPPVASPPVITFDDANTTDFLRLTETGRGFVNGSIGDGTDPAKVDGIAFALANTQPGVTFSVTSSNQAVVTNANINVTTTANGRLLKITPTDEGLTDITLTVTNPDTGTDTYVISYFASQPATDAAHTLYHYGATDGSAAIALDANFMLVANDENEVIGLYDRTQSGLPIKTFNFATDLAFPEKPPEMDIEDAVQVGSRIYWMGSHSNDSGGEDEPTRETIFSTDVSGTGRRRRSRSLPSTQAWKRTLLPGTPAMATASARTTTVLPSAPAPAFRLKASRASISRASSWRPEV